MQIFLLEYDKEKYEILKEYFKNEKVTVVNNDFKNFMDTNDVDCIVSPANSFGLMDGGFDLAITKYFGNELQKDVQNYILNNYYGEQPIGTSFIIKIKNTNKFLIHTPTMRIPSKILDDKIIYQCMRTTLIEAYRNNINSIVIPMFGGLTGKIDPNTISYMMLKAYKQIHNPPNDINWEYAINSHPNVKLLKK